MTRTYSVGDLIRTSGEYDYDSLIDTVTSSIQPESWNTVGGPGAIQGIYAALVVSQVRGAHEQIEALLQACRELSRQLREHPTVVPEPLTVGNRQSNKIRAELNKPISFEFRDAPLAAVVEHLGAAYGIPILIDTQPLEDYGIGTDTPVTLHGKRTPLRSGLRVLLHELDLTWVERDEVLLITTPEEVESMLQLKLYSVGDLVDPFQAGTKSPLLLEGGPSTLEVLRTPEFSAFVNFANIRTPRPDLGTTHPIAAGKTARA